MRNISLQSIQQNPYLDEIIQITSGKNMIADGPLSLQYTKALNEIYKKDTDDETGITLESQVNDAIVSKSLWVAATGTRKELSEQGQEVGMLYGVKQSEVNTSDVVTVSDAITGMTPEEKENSAIVIDTVSLEDNDEIEKNFWALSQEPDAINTNPFAATLESLANENSIELFNSLEAYVNSNKMVDGKYHGTITGNKVSFKIGNKTHKFTNEEGVKGKSVSCTVVVKNNDVYQINVG